MRDGIPALPEGGATHAGDQHRPLQIYTARDGHDSPDRREAVFSCGVMPRNRGERPLAMALKIELDSLEGLDEAVKALYV
jgi:hypothetical protein